MSRLHMMMFTLSLHVADAGRDLWDRAAARARDQRGDVLHLMCNSRVS